MTDLTEKTAESRGILFKTLSATDRTVMENIMMENSGLGLDQIAGNSFGFPMIPLPELREHSERVRLAPKNVTDDFLGHPIYWIDPSITHFDQAKESEEQWSIRMFYIILAMGYWTEDFEWVDYLEQRGFKFESVDVDGYHMASTPICFADDYGLLAEQDLSAPLDRVMNSYRATMSQYSSDLKNDVDKFLRNQMEAMVFAKSILGENIYDSGLEPSSPKSLWFANVYPPLRDLSIQYDDAMASGNYISTLHLPIKWEFDKMRQLLVSIDYISALLTVPVIRSSGSVSDMYGKMISHLGITTAQADSRQYGYDLTDQVEDAMGGSRQVEAVNKIIFMGYDMYRNCWRRMRLAVVNYDRMLNGEPKFSTYTNLELFLVGGNDSRSTDQNESDIGELVELIDEDWDII